MSGHSKWSQIKRQKGVTDAKRSQIFGKLSKIISLAARKGEKPDMNPELRVAIEKAKAANMPADNIERAIKKGAGKLEGAQLENMRYEAYGPGGTAIIMEGITDNKNRTTQEIKHLLSKNGANLAQTGAVTWAFEQAKDRPSLESEGPTFAPAWLPKNKLGLSEQDAEALDKLLEELDDHDDIQDIYTNAE
ncbi:MAG: YebC/PmpR family DNA-binding transcriptional regulator [Candidatus Moranbacteria bacterium]|jgi:YebC/PmpR family DNA-binding regulatory protein|nr:YebC/PmpR family DNA-binding transcriptional regulator [Candidatus Moranbacteria bacterium]